MAKIDTQSIPSELRIKYKRGAQVATTLRGQDYVRSRFPWRLPQMQAGGSDETPEQRTLRDRFRYVVAKYNPLDATTKARWAAANPEYHSYLFGYNFFMLEGLMGGGPVQSPQMIKSIQVIKQSMSKTGNTGFAISAVDPAKTVILINGNSFISDTVQRFSGAADDNTEVTKNLSPNIDLAITEVKVSGNAGAQSVSEGSGDGTWSTWYVSFLSASQVKIKLVNLWSISLFGYFIEVIERKAQTVYPVLVSIAAELITLGWPVAPSVDADISITVVEYL